MSVVTLPPRAAAASSTPRLVLARQSDEDLISLLRAHDTGAFEELVERYRTELLRVCRRMVGSQDAEDILQEVFTSAYFAIVADERPVICRPWLHRIARNRCLNWLRQRHVSEPLAGGDGDTAVGEYLSDGRAGTAETAQLNVELRAIFQDLLDLPAAQRGAVVRYELGGHSYEQISEEMGLSLSSVRSLLLRARSTLLETAEARAISCEEIRADLAQKPLSAVTRRHLKLCKSCASYNKQRRRSLYSFLPFGPGAAASMGSTSATTAAVGPATGGLSAGLGALVAKAAAGLAVLALAGAGAAVIDHTTAPAGRHPTSKLLPASPAPRVSAGLRGLSGSVFEPRSNLKSQSEAGQRGGGGTRIRRLESSGSAETGAASQGAAATSAAGSSAASVPLLTRRTRPLPGSAYTTERTRPALQMAPSGSTTSQTSTSESSTSSAQSTTTTDTTAASSTTSAGAPGSTAGQQGSSTGSS